MQWSLQHTFATMRHYVDSGPLPAGGPVLLGRPISCLAAQFLHTSNIIFNRCAHPLWFLVPRLRKPGDGSLSMMGCSQLVALCILKNVKCTHGLKYFTVSFFSLSGNYQEFLWCNEHLTCFSAPRDFSVDTGIHALSNIERSNVQCRVDYIFCSNDFKHLGCNGRRMFNESPMSS